MTQQKLNLAQISAGFEQMNGVGVPQRVGTCGLRQAGTFAGASHGIGHGVAGQRLVGNLTREHPWLGAHSAPITAQQFQQLGGQLDVAILPALALLNPNHHPLAVNVGSAQMHSFADAPSGAVHRAEDHVVRERWSSLQ